MAKFTLTITTNADHWPASKIEETAERFALRDVLVLVASAIVNRGLHRDGEVTAIKGAHAMYQYVAKAAPRSSDMPPAA